MASEMRPAPASGSSLTFAKPSGRVKPARSMQELSQAALLLNPKAEMTEPAAP